MMRSMTVGLNVLTIRNLNAYDCLTFNGTQIQSVRWKRKPIWLPTAKSKLFRVPQKKHLPEDEMRELKRLFNNYRTQCNSLLKYFHIKYRDSIQCLDTQVIENNIKKDFEMSSYINDRWNEHVAALREQRLAKERKQRKEEIREKVKAKEERELKLQELIDTQVKKAKEEAPTFITRENIDEAIENALKTIVDHNAALDPKGRFHKNIPENSVSSNVMN
ncbi:mitochondrial ribosomal protein S26 [Megachile rotundata]|uniref:mitochondrial ribosomal protein S26 n=1 Tax=Megachile rotundata TaxID=143995 RepID=UPI000258E631|nr:PREDICTED: probable 28S ribosomal protein S26, mitochondrial [Megachile rotundata]